jgi:hypothetical protein
MNLSGLTEQERKHVQGISSAACEALAERFCIMTKDGHVREEEAWRLAYERTCVRYGVTPVPRDS